MNKDRLNELKEYVNRLSINNPVEFKIQCDLMELCTAAIADHSRQVDPGEQSDGYHTFNDLYHHRAILFACLSRCYPDKAWKSLKHYDGTMFDDETFICGIETPQGQYTYHYNTRYWPMFAGKVLDRAPEWDGHKPDDVVRLMSLYPEQSRKVTDATRDNTEQTFQSFLASPHDPDWIGNTISHDYLVTAIKQALRRPTVDVAEIDRAVANISARYAKTIEDGKANTLAITALKRMKG